MQHFLTTLLFTFFALNVQSQITGIKIIGDTCRQSEHVVHLISFGILTTLQVALMIQQQLQG